MPTIVNNSPGAVPLRRTRGLVEVKATWTDSWTYVHDLRPLRCTLAAAPEVPSADLEWHFGEVLGHGGTQFGLRPPLNLSGWYCRILMQDEGQAAQPIWTGVIVEQTNLAPSPLPEGRQVFRAFGLAHLLDNITIRRSYAKQKDDVVALDWVPAFNVRHRRGKYLTGNRSNSQAGGAYLFGSDGETWTNKEIVDALLAWLADDLPSGPTVFLSGQSDVLDGIEEVHRLEGLSVWEALNRLIDRRRGVGFHLVVDDSGTVRVECWSVSDVPVTVGERTLPANPLQTSFDLPSGYPYAHFVGPIAVRASGVAQVNKIVAQSERLKVTATFSIEDENIEEAYSSALKLAYQDGAGSTTDYLANDRARTIDRFEGVYTRFRIKPGWDGTVKNGEGSGSEQVRLVANKNGQLLKGDSPGPWWRFGKRFLRELPFEVGKRYDTSGITVENLPDAEPEFRSFFVFYNDKDDGVAHKKTSKWYFVDQMYAANPLFAAVDVRPLDKELGFQLGVTPRHYFAHGDYDFGTRPTAHLPELKIPNLGCTGTIEMDVRAKIEIDRQGPVLESGSTYVITVEGAEYWYVAPGTIIDIDKDGKPVRIHQERRYVRQDKRKLEAAAAQAAAWFGPRRQAIVLPLKRLTLGVPIGTILTGINTSYAVEPVRTPVTAVRLDFYAGTTEVETGYTALDFSEQI